MMKMDSHEEVRVCVCVCTCVCVNVSTPPCRGAVCLPLVAVLGTSGSLRELTLHVAEKTSWCLPTTFRGREIRCLWYLEICMSSFYMVLCVSTVLCEHHGAGTAVSVLVLTIELAHMHTQDAFDIHCLQWCQTLP